MESCLILAILPSTVGRNSTKSTSITTRQRCDYKKVLSRRKNIFCADCFDHWWHTNRRCVGKTVGNRQRCQLLGPPSEGSSTPIFIFFYKKYSLSSFAGKSPKLASENLGVWTASGDIYPQCFARISFFLILLRFRWKEIDFLFFGWLNMGYRLLESLFNCQLRFLAVYQVVCLGSIFFNFKEKSRKRPVYGIWMCLILPVVHILISRILEYPFLLWMCPRISFKF